MFGCRQLTRHRIYKRFFHEDVTQPKVKKDVFNSRVPPMYSVSQVEVQSGWYEWWEKEKFFHADYQDMAKKSTRRFSMILPPPNVTGTLHIGHALTNVIQDAVCRWHRMNGEQVLWVPGCDHAGIATQVVVEKVLWQKFKKRHRDVGKEKFIEEIWKWKDQKEKKIYQQLKRLGSSLDWSMKTFSMDPNMMRAVTEAFVRLHEQGLIVRETSIVNWCCHLRSTISDIEVDYVEYKEPGKIRVPTHDEPIEVGYMDHIAYPVSGSATNEKLIVATTRPETIFGDTAVAVHPNDDRYSKFHNARVVNPLTGKELPVVCDEFVDREMGTGAVKITPAHDPDDYAVAMKHKLDIMEVIDENGKMKNVPVEFNDLQRFVARKAVLKMLDARGFRQRFAHPMSLPMCSRSGDIIEHRLKKQWFVLCDVLAQNALKAVESGSLRIMPESAVGTWNEWCSKSTKWCISRQLVWGHPIPAYYGTVKGTEKGVWVSGRNKAEAETKAAALLATECSNVSLEQDNDVLDTWFSSALFPFSVMGWPENTDKLQKFYPLSLMETGHDILTFWVIRMVMLGQQLTGVLPFNEIFLHGMIVDIHGRKMSKSLGNVIDPLDIVNGVSLEHLTEQLEGAHKEGLVTKKEMEIALKGKKKDYPNGIPASGADALRFTLCIGNVQSGVIKLNVDKAKIYSHFCNKIWQVARFVTAAQDDVCGHITDSFDTVNEQFQPLDLWILSRLAETIETCNMAFTDYKLHYATQTLYRFIYKEFCDVYVEHSKPILRSDDESAKMLTCSVLVHCLQNALLALSPFMPFLTEELFQYVPMKQMYKSICIAPYPKTKNWLHWRNCNLEKEVEVVMDIVSIIRGLRVEFGLKQKPEVIASCDEGPLKSSLDRFQSSIFALSRCARFDIVSPYLEVRSPGHFVLNVKPELCLHVYSDEKPEDRVKAHTQLLKDEQKLVQKLTTLPGDETEKTVNEKKALQSTLIKIQKTREAIESLM